MKKTIVSIRLFEKDIDKAIKELEQYKRYVIHKSTLLHEKIAEKIASLSRSGFAGAVVDDVLRGGAKTAQVDVLLDSQENVSLVIANGEDAIWVEFGAGVFHNSSSGFSPHPEGAELGFTIGSYGKGMGKKEVWGYYEDGELRLTCGTPAIMPMHNAVKIVCDQIADIAREVFR